MNTKTIKFDLNKYKLYEKIKAKQGDTKSRFLLFQLLDGSIPFNLKNRSVRAYMIKPDGREIFNDLIVNNYNLGYCTLELTNQVLAAQGIVKIELMVTEGDKKLTSSVFELEVVKSINSEKSIVSTNEFTALLNGLAALSEYDNYKNSVKEMEINKANKAEVEEKFISVEEKIKNNSEQLEHITNLGYVDVLKCGTIEKAIEQLKLNGGGTLFFGDGIFIIPRLQFLYTDYTSEVRIKGNGKERTILKFLDDVNLSAIDFNYVSCDISDLTLEGLKTADDYNDYQTHLSHHGIQIRDCTGYVNITNCLVKNFRSNGISIIGASNINIENNHIKDCYGESILTSVNGIKSRIINNTCENALWGIDSNVIDTIIDGNRIINCNSAITFENMNHDETVDGEKYHNTKIGTINNNTIEKCLDGINVSTANFKYKVDNVTISNNKITLKGNGEIRGQGITLDKVCNIDIIGNVIRNCYATLNYQESANGIYIQDGDNITIENNTIDGVGRMGISLKDMNSLSDTNAQYKINNIHIKNNRIYNIGSCGVSTRKNIYNLTIENNEYINCDTSMLIVNNIDELTIKNNKEINCINTVSHLDGSGNINVKLNNITFSDGWRNHAVGESLYSKENGIVTVSLICQTSENVVNKIICNLPDGYRPIKNMFGTVTYFDYNGTTKTDIIKIDGNGNIELLNSINGVSLLGFSISFYEK